MTEMAAVIGSFFLYYVHRSRKYFFPCIYSNWCNTFLLPSKVITIL